MDSVVGRFGLAVAPRACWSRAGIPPGLVPRNAGAAFAAALLLLLPLVLGWRRQTGTLGLSAVGACPCWVRTCLSRPPVATTSSLEYYTQVGSSTREAVTGIVLEGPVQGDASQRLRIKAEGLQLSSEKTPRVVSGELLALVSRYPAYQAGDRLLLKGVLAAPPDVAGFDYRAYLAAHGIYSYMYFPDAKLLSRDQVRRLANRTRLKGRHRRRYSGGPSLYRRPR